MLIDLAGLISGTGGLLSVEECSLIESLAILELSWLLCWVLLRYVALLQQMTKRKVNYDTYRIYVIHMHNCFFYI